MVSHPSKKNVECGQNSADGCADGQSTPPPPCISYARVQATVGVGTVIIVYVILIAYGM